MRDFHLPGRSPVIAAGGMCAASHPLAALIAIDILRRGGNAADAAVAAAAMLGICEPHMTGIGGDCFALVSPAGSDEIAALNGSGRAPAAISADSLRERGLDAVPLRGVEAVTIPGAVDGLCRLSAEHGRLGLDAVLEPAIRHAEEGVPVAPRVSVDLASCSEFLQGHAPAHFSQGGRPLALGERFRAPGQAEVLRRIARHGRAAFYEGEVAEDMLAALREAGGCHTAEDFAANACDAAEPISGDYAGAQILEHPPNGQGATAILMLNILKSFDAAAMDPWGSARAHIEAEAAKLAYDARNRIIADPDHVARLEFMLAQETAERLAGLIDPKATMPAAAPLTEHLHRDTVYLAVVDSDRMAVSMIQSLYHGFGSGIASEKFGILFQNRGAGFTLEPGHPNELGGGKRPMHTIIPGMLRMPGGPAWPFGVMGGPYQPNGHARFVSNLLDHGLSPQEAIDGPRSFAEEGELKVERGYPDAVRRELEELGHKVTIPDIPIGGAQAILIREDGTLEGGSDPRKDGCALGH